jgi:hypothetical protein
MMAKAEEPKKLWGGRFTGDTDPLMEKFNESLPFDKRLWKEDLTVRSTDALELTGCLLPSISDCHHRSALMLVCAQQCSAVVSSAGIQGICTGA